MRNNLTLSISLLVVLSFSSIMCSTNKIEMNQNVNHHKTIIDFGAKLDGLTDDSQAIMRSLDELGYAYLPHSKEGIRIDKTIYIKDGQKVEGERRSVRVISGVKTDEYTFKISNIPFSGSAYLQNFTLSFLNRGANGIHVIDSRQAHILDFTILGKKKCDIGILVEGKVKGSAWNVIDRYSISSTLSAAIKLESSTKKPWVNRNYIGYGVAQSCGIGLWIDRGGTNTSLMNPQNCDIGILIDLNSNSNRIETFMESCDVSVEIRGKSRNNMISGNLNTKKVKGKGTNTVWRLPNPKMKILDSN